MKNIILVYLDPVVRSLDPERKHFLEASEISEPMNPFENEGISMMALTIKGFPHIKTVPAFQMMLEDFNAGLYKNKHTIVVDSSGNTAHAVARLAPAFGFKNVIVVLSADVPEVKKSILAALSTVDIIIVGKGKDVALRAREEGERKGFIHINQYSHMGNARAHEFYTGPEITRALNKNIGVIAIAMGSGGTVAGVGSFLKKNYPDTVVLGVRPNPGESVPGARNKKKMDAVVTIPWEESVDFVVDISRKMAFKNTRRLWQFVEPQPGPTSGLAYSGLVSFMGCIGDKGRSSLEGTNIAFLCPDDGRFYSDLFLSELEPEQGI